MQTDTAVLQDNPRWAAFKASLIKNSFFKGNIAGSAQYKELLTEAAQSFMRSQKQQEAVEATDGPAESIASILQQPICPEQFKVTDSVFCRISAQICHHCFNTVNVPTQSRMMNAL